MMMKQENPVDLQADDAIRINSCCCRFFEVRRLSSATTQVFRRRMNENESGSNELIEFFFLCGCLGIEKIRRSQSILV